jgi:hypothetical protein
VVQLRLNPHPRLRRECGTRKFDGFRFGGVEGWATRPAKALRSFWQRRFYDFNVWSTKKRIEKLNYMHRNPAKRGLVAEPGLWAWSSYRFYQYGEKSVCTPDREPK